MIGKRRPLAAIAEERVSFEQAMAWVSDGTAARSRGSKTACPMCGESGAFRVYPDHGYCFAESRYVSTIGLLADKWELSREDAAARALEKIGWVPADYAHMWAGAQRQQAPAHQELAEALRIWCGASCEDWAARQFDQRPSAALARCLGLLPRVRTEDDCELWLARCKQLMGRVLGIPGS